MAEKRDLFRATPEYAARPVVLPSSLSELTGQKTGIVSLPIWLCWSPTNDFDLASEQRVRTLYQTVLQTALAPSDLRFLDADTLLAVWSTLRLPRQTRSMWEERFPELQPADDYSRWEGEGGHPPYNERGATLA